MGTKIFGAEKAKALAAHARDRMAKGAKWCDCPACAACEYLPRCCGGCMVEGITDEGDYLVPDERCCYFHRHIGEDAVRAVADAAIRKYCGERHM